MSTTVVFVFGILSLSISALATTWISKRREIRAKANTAATRPLILPWLVSADLPHQTGSISRSEIPAGPRTIHPNAYRDRDDLASFKSRSISGRLDFLPPYMELPKSSRLASNGRGSVEKKLHTRAPVGVIPELPYPAVQSTSDLGHTNPSSDLEAFKEVHPKRYTMPSLPTRYSTDLSADFISKPPPSDQHQDQPDQPASRPPSISSISTTVNSTYRDSVFGIDEFQKLEFVIGCGHRIQAQYGTLNSPRSEHEAPVLTPIKKVCHFDEGLQSEPNKPPGALLWQPISA